MNKYLDIISWIVFIVNILHCNPVQGQCSKFSQGKTCFHYKEPLFSLQGPCIHYREFPVRITTQGNPCSHYRECRFAVYQLYDLKLNFPSWVLTTWELALAFFCGIAYRALGTRVARSILLSSENTSFRQNRTLFYCDLI